MTVICMVIRIYIVNNNLNNYIEEKMKIFKILLIITVAALTGISCSDNSTAIEEEEELESLGVRLVNTGSGEFEVESNGEKSIFFCYDDGCETPGGGSFATVSENDQMVFHFSEPERQAIGAFVGFEVTSGQGRFELVNGVSYNDDGWQEFTVNDVIYTSEEFSNGDVAEYTYGDMN